MWVTTVTAQEKTLNGRVIAEQEDVTGVTIQNLRSQKATITDFDGNFSIAVKEDDTLVFSSVQLKRKVVSVNKLLMNTSYVTVPMEPFVNELREVVVRPFGLSGDLSKDVGTLNTKVVDKYSLGLPNADVKIPTQSERKLQEASKGTYSLKNPLRVGVLPLINAITGRTKMLKKRVATDNNYARTERVKNFYVDSIFLIEFKIPVNKVDDFMYFCEVDPEFQQLVARKDQLKLWAYMQRRSAIYRENNGIQE
ncbi:carboxypeptidase-like regulatory domain-containing protein [Flavobacterium sp. ASW18X]|uniref:carboxypeptidase-like regulatory domain-containing protein n=1 Tax=Flavobacterium sp. ASW18X TaxID=2572595 RepID=UPI001F0EF8B8|nr:carboxypeptidase-like regulatory domain-containing protein [Flavobacterium sp. ASW18X]